LSFFLFEGMIKKIMAEKFIIQGGKPLNGTIETRGAKNAAFPILAASLLTDESCVIDNLPLIEDVFKMIEIIEKLGAVDKIDADIATCLYVGIMTDTGSFRFPSTTSTTHRIIADLIDKGANNAEIHNNIYDTNSYSRLQLLGRALSNLKVETEYRTAYISLSQAELDEFNFQKGDTEGVVNYALSLDGIVFAAIFIEDVEQKIIKMSLRSKGSFSVNQFARNHFNGGGHDNAAGAASGGGMHRAFGMVLLTNANGDSCDMFFNLFRMGIRDTFSFFLNLRVCHVFIISHLLIHHSFWPNFYDSVGYRVCKSMIMRCKH